MMRAVTSRVFEVDNGNKCTAFTSLTYAWEPSGDIKNLMRPFCPYFSANIFRSF